MKFLPLALLLIFATTCTGNQSRELNEKTNFSADRQAVEEDVAASSITQESPSAPKADISSETVSEFPKAGWLIAEQPDAQINLRSQPSTTSPDNGYGLVGDNVTLLNSTEGADGFTWYYVRFDSSRAEGWIRSDLISVSGVRTDSAVASSSTTVKQVFPKLSVEQEIQLLNIDENNERGIDVKIVLPTYVPINFSISEFVIEDSRFGPSYRVIYSDEQNNCFEIAAASGGFGAEPKDFEVVSVNSKALGQVNLGFTQFDAVTSQQKIGFEHFNVPGIISSSQEYSFWSPANNLDCKAIDFQEAIRVVESLDYLNP